MSSVSLRCNVPSPPYQALEAARLDEPSFSQVMDVSDNDDRSDWVSSDGCAYRYAYLVWRGGLWKWGREGLACFSMCCTPVDLVCHLPSLHERNFHLQHHCC
jgi:hypothetical protein